MNRQQITENRIANAATHIRRAYEDLHACTYGEETEYTEEELKELRDYLALSVSEELECLNRMIVAFNRKHGTHQPNKRKVQNYEA